MDNNKKKINQKIHFLNPYITFPHRSQHEYRHYRCPRWQKTENMGQKQFLETMFWNFPGPKTEDPSKSRIPFIPWQYTFPIFSKELTFESSAFFVLNDSL